MDYLEVTVFVWREGKWYIAYEPSSGIASQGKSVKEALDNLREALELYLEEKDAKIYQVERVMITKLKIPIKEKEHKMKIIEAPIH